MPIRSLIRAMLVHSAFGSALLFGGAALTAGEMTVFPSAAAATSPSKLGNLSAFRVIVVDTKALTDKGDLGGPALVPI
jgi:hypothetical protein